MLSPEQITVIYCIVDDLLQVYPLKQDKRAQLCDSEIITLALVACFDFCGVYIESMRFLHQYGYISNLISKSRLSRRLSRLEPVAEELFQAIAYLFTQAAAQRNSFWIPHHWKYAITSAYADAGCYRERSSGDIRPLSEDTFMD